MPDNNEKKLVVIKCGGMYKDADGNNVRCPGVVALASLERGYVQILRKPKQPSSKTMVMVTGNSFDVAANCHNMFCTATTNISVEGGKLKTEGLRIKDDSNVQKKDDKES